MEENREGLYTSSSGFEGIQMKYYCKITSYKVDEYKFDDVDCTPVHLENPSVIVPVNLE